MRTIVVIGIGTGSPAHMTLEAIAALTAADHVFIPTKGEDKAALADLRRAICDQHLDDADARITEFALPVRDAANASYRAGVDDWHAEIAERYESLITRMGETDSAALLVWGDPGLYDSTLRILERVRARNAVDFSTTVIPGITAIQALTAAFAIPLNRIGAPVLITTGRRLAAGWPDDADTIVVMLDGRQAFAALEDPDLYIYWGAYLGAPEQILLQGPLHAIRDEITTARAAARERHGWIMDTYLIRKG